MSMELLHEFLDTVSRHGTAKGNLKGLLHILVGRTIKKGDAVVSHGLSWRSLAEELKRLRWDREQVKEFGADVDELPPRDRQRFWFSAIAQAGLDSADAVTAANRLVAPLRKLGYEVGPAPGAKR